MKKITKIGLSYGVFQSAENIRQAVTAAHSIDRLTKDQLTSALVFIKKAEEILKPKSSYK